MLRTVFAWVGYAVLGVGCVRAAQLQQQPSFPAPQPALQYRAVLNKYCVTCHNEKLKTAELMLDKMDVENVPPGAEVWEKVIRKLRTGAMPPTGMPRPDQATYDSFATYLETSLDRAAAAKLNPGRPTVHRLNRAEYANVIRDLLATEIDTGKLLPPDDSGYGFDNIGDVLSVSPTLLERYISAAGKISRLAVGEPGVRPVVETYNVPLTLQQSDRMSEDLPFGSRGGTAIRHYFPLDGEYSFKIRLQKANGGFNRGAPQPRQLDLRLDGARLKLFTVGAAKPQPGLTLEDIGDAKTDEAEAALEVRVPVNAGPHLIGVTFLREQAAQPEGVLMPHLDSTAETDQNGRASVAEPSLGGVIVSGPYNSKGLGETPSRRKIFVCHPTGAQDEEACAKKILATLARHAYRRPVADPDLQSLIGFYKTGRSEGGFEAGIEMALERMLVSLEFLFRIERDPANAAPNSIYPISDMDLASRLSFFLWSSIPDDELLDLAAQGKLKSSEVLQQQVRRMLKDPRSKALVSNFAGQWLLLRNIPRMTPDPVEFPDFDGNLREAFQKETELFFESMLHEDRPLLDLLTANYTFVNERLARHYGIPNVYGSHFRRVTLNDENRRGLLGQGSLLTLTSYATRTSVVLRGKWLLENVLGAPPPPPPPGVPALKDRDDDGKILSVRQQMEAHRANPVCGSCHSRMDPLGFALENFNGIGKWRTTEGAGNTPIDSSGVLPDGTKFQGPAELRKMLLSKSDQFVNTVTEKLLTYALGRGVEYYDEPTVRKITRDSASGDYRWSSIISGIARSEPFQMRRSREP